MDKVSNNLKWFARGPRYQSMSYSRFVINGLRFHTKDAEKCRHQNSGVLVEVTTICRSSTKDNYEATIPLDISQPIIDNHEDDDENYVRIDVEGVFCDK